MKTRIRFFPGQWLPLLTMIGTLAAVVCPPLAHSEAAVEAWARRYSNTTESQDQGYQVATDTSGNVIVAGYTDEGVTGPDILLIKYSSAGAALWTNRYDGPFHSTDSPHALAVDGADNVIVTGYSYGGASYFDWVTIKYSSTGVGLWTNLYNGPGDVYDSAAAVAVDANGNVYVTGTSDGLGTGNDYLTIAYSSAGVGLWTNRYNGPGNGDDVPYAVALAADGSGNVLVTGYSTGSGTSEDYATIAYSSAGATLWVNRYNGPANSYDYANRLAVDGSGNVYVTGNSDDGSSNDDYATVAYSSNGVGLWTNRYNGTSDSYDVALAVTVGGGTNVYVTGYSGDLATGEDFATIAYSSAGVALWTNRYNGPGNGQDEAYTLAADASGNVYVTGVAYNPGADWDYTTIAYSSAGTVLWIARYNGPGNARDEGYAVAVANSGNVVVTGYSTGSGGSYDWATVAYSSLGVGLWTNRYNGPGNNDDSPYAVALDGSGNIFVAGWSWGGGSGEDWATVAYSSAGAPLWTNRFQGLNYQSDRALALAVDASGKVFVTGYSFVAASEDYTTIAYSSAGTPLWTNFYDGPVSFGDHAQAVAVGDGNVYVTGYSDGAGGDDYATIAYSSVGVALWTNRYDGPENGTDVAQAVAAYGGNVYVTGYSQGAGNSDFATVAYSSAGTALWTNRYNGPANNDDRVQAVAVDGNGNVVVTGYSGGDGSSEDYATIKYSSAGVALWTNRYNGPGNGTDQARGLAVDASGDVFVTGYSRGSGADDDYATIAYSSAGVPLWTNRYNGPGNDEDRALAVAADGTGGVYVTGHSYSGAGSLTTDFTTIAYSTAGVALWTNHYNGPFNGVDQPLYSRSLAVGADGSVVVVGQSAGRYSGNGAYDYATVKYITGEPPPPPPGPPLTIIPYGTSVLLVWPTLPAGFHLQSATNLFAPAGWQGGFPPPIVLDGYNVVVEPITGDRKFYRLVRP